MKIVLANQFKNEQKRLKEWLLYYKSLGVCDFIFTDDHSTDDSLSIIKSISGINVDILKSEFEPDNKFFSSVDTDRYAGTKVAGNIGENFIKMHDFCKKAHGNEVFLGFFDVDEFIFFDTSKTSLLNLIENNIQNCPVLCLNSTEVDCNTFDVDGSWLTLQNHKAVSRENAHLCTRVSTTKAFQNLSFQDSSVFIKHRKTKNNTGGFVHCGGVESHQINFYPRELCAFLHFRKPMYSPEINRKLCTKHYTWVDDIAKKAYELL
jgi:hypothetical protein